MIRIVKLTFKKEHRQDFLDFIETKKDQICSFEGCNGVDFLNDIENPSIFFTYSKWNDTAALENYRKSELFNSIWSQVKLWFDAKAEAWSVEIIE